MFVWFSSFVANPLSAMCQMHTQPTWGPKANKPMPERRTSTMLVGKLNPTCCKVGACGPKRTPWEHMPHHSAKGHPHQECMPPQGCAAAPGPPWALQIGMLGVATVPCPHHGGINDWMPTNTQQARGNALLGRSLDAHHCHKTVAVSTQRT